MAIYSRFDLAYNRLDLCCLSVLEVLSMSLFVALTLTGLVVIAVATLKRALQKGKRNSAHGQCRACPKKDDCHDS
jgi:ABC-type nickel/cobalt efflux system permease component RcnA